MKENIKVIAKRFYKVETCEGLDLRIVLNIQYGNSEYTLHRAFGQFQEEVDNKKVLRSIDDYTLSNIIGQEVTFKLEPAQVGSKYEVINLKHFVESNNLQLKQKQATISQVLAFFR